MCLKEAKDQTLHEKLEPPRHTGKHLADIDRRQYSFEGMRKGNGGSWACVQII